MKNLLIALLLSIPFALSAQLSPCDESDTSEVNMGPLGKNEYSAICGHFTPHGKNMPTYEFSFYVGEGVKDIELDLELIINDGVHAPAQKWHPKHAMDVDIKHGLADHDIHHKWTFPDAGLEDVGDITLPLHVSAKQSGWVPVSVGIHGRKGHTTLVLWLGRSFLAEFDLAGFPSEESNGQVLCHVTSNDARLVEKVLGMVENADLEGHEFPEMKTIVENDMVTFEWWFLHPENVYDYRIYEVDKEGERRLMRLINPTSNHDIHRKVLVDMPEKGNWIEVDLEIAGESAIIGEFHPWDGEETGGEGDGEK